MSEMIVRVGGKQIMGPVKSTAEMIQECREEVAKFLGHGRMAKAVYLGAGLTGVADMFLLSAERAFAAGPSLSAAFEPVKNLLIDMADPLCYIMFVWGCIECIVGRPASGLSRMKYASIGYIAINWIPVLMAVIRNAGGAAQA
jgi:hypothetical protein